MALITSAGKGAPLTPAEADGNLTEIETRTGAGWADIVSELFIRDTPAAPIAQPFRGGLVLWDFTDGDMREVYANFHVPHSWKAGTMIYPHMHFSVNSSNSGTIRWGFEYSWARRHDSTGQIVFPASSTITLDFEVPANSEYKHFVAEVPQGQGIVGTGLEVDAMILMRIYRDGGSAADTFAGSAFGITADLHIEVDRASTPNRAPNFYA